MMKYISIDTLIKSIGDLKLDAFLVSNSSNIFYLSGFEGLVPHERESYVVCIDKKLHLIAPRLYEQEAFLCQENGVEVHIDAERTGLLKTAIGLLGKSKVAYCGFESEDLKYLEFELMKEHASSISFIGHRHFISQLRCIKTDGEVELIRQAQEISYKAFESIIPQIKPGIKEHEIKDRLVSSMRSLGAQGESFEAIIAVGQNAALPHYRTGNTVLNRGDLLLLDFGAKYMGYCGDTTRMLFFGTPNDEVVKTYELVLEAQKSAITRIKAGITSHEGFEYASQVFKKSNTLDHFTHGLGHGIGLEVHEAPYLRPGLETPLMEGMVFSIEPGLYYPEWGGVRIEDLVVCRRDGVEVLGDNSQEMRIV